MDRGIVFLKELPSPTFNHGLPDQDGLHGLALELPVASCPPGDGAWLDSSVRRSRRLLIRWRWAVVPPIEGEVDVQPANDVIDEERVQREAAVEHHEELYLEASSREWEEERSSSSLELRIASPKSPLVIPDSPSARAYLTIFILVPLPIPCYPHQELSYTYSRMICSSLSIGALPGAGSSLSSPTSLTAGNHHKIQGITNNPTLMPTHHANIQSCIQRLVLQVVASLARLTRFVFHYLTCFRSLTPRVLEITIRTCHHSSVSLRSARRETLHFYSTSYGPVTM